MWMFILKCLYFMLPAYFANMAPVIIKYNFKSLTIPIDLNKKIRNKPIFGKNKTFRGFIFGVLFSLAIAFIQHLLYNLDFFANISFLGYSNWLIIGFLMGLGAMTGDLVESFFKRRFGIEPGKPFTPWDQLDFVIGALFFVSFVFLPTIPIIMTILIFSFILHILVNHIAFYLKLSKTRL